MIWTLIVLNIYDMYETLLVVMQTNTEHFKTISTGAMTYQSFPKVDQNAGSW